MKKIFLSSACIVLSMFLVSCNSKKTDDPKAGEPIKIQLKIQGATKAIGDANDADNTINDLIVFVATDNGDLDIAPQYFLGTQITAGDLPAIQATDAASKVYIVCNTGPLATGVFNGVANMAEVERKAMALDGNTNAGSQCINGNVWMYGSSVLDPVVVAGNITRTATVNLKYIPAKVYVVIENNITNYDPSTNRTVIDGAFMFNVGAWTRFIENIDAFKPVRSDITTPGNVPFFYNGRAMATWTDQPILVGGQPDHAVRSFLDWAPAGTFPIMTSPLTVSQAFEDGFYVFPSITTNLTYLSLHGRFNPNGSVLSNAVGRVDYFWTFAFGGPDGLAGKITSGNQYVVTFTLNGDDATGGGGGEDPGEIPVPTDIVITVVPAAWNVKLINKVIN